MHRVIHYGSIAFFVVLVVIGIRASAAVMSSASYRLQSDSINVGGYDSSSASYRVHDTSGEIASGDSSSSNYAMKAGYQHMQEVYLSISTAADVTMSPSIGGVTGGTANGSTAVTVTTDSPAGYTVSIKASSSPALVSGVNSFADYAPAGADPDFNFSIAASASAFGFSPEGTDIAQAYKDNGSVCNTGSGDTADKCWNGLSTTPKIIVSRTSGNHPSGTATTIKFRASSGASHLQVDGVYNATTTLTAISL